MESTVRKAIKHFGKEHQCMVAVEELSELQKEISKFVRGRNNREAITEEIADVYIVIEQIRIMADIDIEDIGEVIAEKIDRLKRRMTDEVL